MKTPRKPQRLEIRIKKDIKSIIQKAADLAGVTLTDFVVNSSYLEAKRFIESYNEIKTYMVKL